MKINRCPQGHFYDGDRYGTCPLCPRAPRVFRPTVGWLVCLEEPCRGLDIRLHPGINTLGGDIPLPGVEEPTALICYDAQTRLFTFGPTNGGTAAVNDQPVTDPVILHDRDKLRVGTALMQFVPLEKLS